MAGLLDFLLNGQGGGVLPPFAQNFGAGDPGNASPVAAPAASQAYAQAPQQQPQQVAQAAPQYAQPQMATPQSPQMPQVGGPPGLSGLAGLFAGLNPQAGALFQKQMMMRQMYNVLTAPKERGGAGLSPAQAMIGLNNGDALKFFGGVPVNNGIAEDPNGAKIPVISTPGNVGQYAMPQDPTMRSRFINAPVKLGDLKAGAEGVAGPALYQGGQNVSLMPGAVGSIGGNPQSTTTAQQSTTPAQPPTGQVSGLSGAMNLVNQFKEQGAAAEARGKAYGAAQAAFPQTIAKIDNMLKIIDSVDKDPDLTLALGPLMGHLPPIGGSQARAVSKVEQLEGQVFLQAFAEMKSGSGGAGGVRLTQQEIFKANDAEARLQRPQTLADFRQGLAEMRDVVTGYRNRAAAMAGLPSSATPQPPTEQQGGQQQAAPSTWTDPKSGKSYRVINGKLYQ